jgi:hypothetical protein
VGEPGKSVQIARMRSTHVWHESGPTHLAPPACHTDPWWYPIALREERGNVAEAVLQLRALCLSREFFARAKAGGPQKTGGSAPQPAIPKRCLGVVP